MMLLYACMLSVLTHTCSKMEGRGSVWCPVHHGFVSEHGDDELGSCQNCMRRNDIIQNHVNLLKAVLGNELNCFACKCALCWATYCVCRSYLDDVCVSALGGGVDGLEAIIASRLQVALGLVQEAERSQPSLLSGEIDGRGSWVCHTVNPPLKMQVRGLDIVHSLTYHQLLSAWEASYISF